MTSVALTVHSVEVYQGGPGVPPALPLGDFDMRGGSVLDYTARFLKRMVPANGRGVGGQNFATIRNIADVDAHTVHGALEMGSYGTGGRIVNVQTAVDRYVRSTDDAELHPYYFLFYCPPTGTRGVLILQKLGHSSPLSVFEKAVASSFAAGHQPYRLRLGRIVPTELLRRYLTDGEVKGIDFDFNYLPPDVADDVYGNSIGRRSGRLRTSIIAERGGSLQVPGWLLAIQNGGAFPNHVTLHGEQVDEAAVEVQYGGKRRRIVVTDTAQFRGAVDLSGSVERDSNNLPLFTSVDAEAQALLLDIRQQEGL